jgi:hypothetical protein
MNFFNKRYIITILVFVFMFSEYVYAYLDPGTGSYMLQIILAGLLGIGVGVRAYWTKIKSFFKKTNKVDE